MGLFDLGKKKEAPAQGSRVPIEEVIRMRRQGLSNNQIVQALQRNGYQSHQIFDAFNQADLKAPVQMQGTSTRQGYPSGGPEGLGEPPDLPPFSGEQESEATINGPQSPEEIPRTQGMFPEEAAQPQPEQYGGYSTGHDNSAKIEEISEAIIEEKWQDLTKDFNKLVEWKSGMEQRMAAIEQRFTDVKTAFDVLQKSVVDKVSDYDKSVRDVGSEMKALEQVFQKIIPTLTENVNELSRITKGMKPAEKKKQAPL